MLEEHTPYRTMPLYPSPRVLVHMKRDSHYFPNNAGLLVYSIVIPITFTMTRVDLGLLFPNLSSFLQKPWPDAIFFAYYTC
jgi:hypothetical protein